MPRLSKGMQGGGGGPTSRGEESKELAVIQRGSKGKPQITLRKIGGQIFEAHSPGSGWVVTKPKPSNRSRLTVSDAFASKR